MKTTKLFLIATFCLLVLSANSQNHITFNNIPLNGDVVKFAKELVSQGYVIKETKDKVITLTGNYMDRQCEVMVFATSRSSIVWKVVMNIPLEKNWSLIKKDYLNLKEQFITKNGAGKSIETFTEPYFEGDGCELQALKLAKCNYAINWEKPEGIISLKLSKYRQIVISYEDNVNYAIEEKEKSEQIMNEIN